MECVLCDRESHFFVKEGLKDSQNFKGLSEEKFRDSPEIYFVARQINDLLEKTSLILIVDFTTSLRKISFNFDSFAVQSLHQNSQKCLNLRKKYF